MQLHLHRPGDGAGHTTARLGAILRRPSGNGLPKGAFACRTGMDLLPHQTKFPRACPLCVVACHSQLTNGRRRMWLIIAAPPQSRPHDGPVAYLASFHGLLYTSVSTMRSNESVERCCDRFHSNAEESSQVALQCRQALGRPPWRRGRTVLSHGLRDHSALIKPSSHLRRSYIRTQSNKSQSNLSVRILTTARVRTTPPATHGHRGTTSPCFAVSRSSLASLEVFCWIHEQSLHGCKGRVLDVQVAAPYACALERLDSDRITALDK